MSDERVFRRKKRPARPQSPDDTRPVPPLERSVKAPPRPAAETAPEPETRPEAEAPAPRRKFRRKNPPKRKTPPPAPQPPAATAPAAPVKPARPAQAAEALRLDPGQPVEAVPQPATDAPPAPFLAATEADAFWSGLVHFPVDEKLLDKHRVVTASRYDPAHTAFDVLRTRLLQALSERGWKRIVITSPTEGCGKTFTAANLSVSLARQENCRTILFDADLRNPSLAKIFGVRNPGAIGKLLRGEVAPEEQLRRFGPNTIHAGPNLAFAFNDAKEPYASELLQDPRTGRTLARIEAQFEPDVMLFDMPPALYGDDVMAFRPFVDAVILVVGGGLTTAQEIRDVEARLGADTPLLGVVMNKAEATKVRKYSY